MSTGVGRTGQEVRKGTGFRRERAGNVPVVMVSVLDFVDDVAGFEPVVASSGLGILRGFIGRWRQMFYGAPPFEDRQDAGRRLGERLLGYRNERPVVFALPRGGVPVGYEVARPLGAPLEVLVARKLGAPDQPEFGIGAVAPGGVRVLNVDVVRRLGIPEDYVEWITRRETEEVERRLKHFRGERPEPEMRDRSAIIVDDGLATGVTARAAIKALRLREPRRIVLAVPVCAAQTARLISSEADELVCLECPADLGAIGFWYRDFSQVPDEEVIELLERARAELEQDGRGTSTDESRWL